jgi:single-strand DNA-binding protein
MALPHIEIVGNLVQDPELRFTANGVAVANLRIGASDRRQDETGKWVEKDKLFINATCWRDHATLAAENLNKGDSVAIMGKLKQNEYTDQAGQKRISYEIEATTVSKVLKPYKMDKQPDQSVTWNPSPASGSTDNTIWGESF